MMLQRSPEQQAALDQLVIDQQNPKSADYHHWLTPIEFGERFGLSNSDIAVLRTWLESEGLHVDWVAPSQTFIGFSGDAANVGRAFGTTVRNYTVTGELRYSVEGDVAVPTSLSPAIKSIRGLYTIHERPSYQMAAARSVSPDLTLSDGSHIITPLDFQKIYDGDSTYNGVGQTIGIVGRSRIYGQDRMNFNAKTATGFFDPYEVVPTAFGGVDPGPALTSPPNGTPVFGDQGEATLDVLRAGSTAQGAGQILVVATDASGGIAADAQYLIQTTPLPAQVMNISFGECESEAGPAGVSFWDTLFEQAAAEGISVFVASGDSGAAGCEAAFTDPPAVTVANSPNYICSSSYATCVGGTEFNDASNPSRYWSSQNGQGLGSALGYIPEGGWNEPMNGTTTQVAASGGGVSSYVPTPSWQIGTGVPTVRTGRYTPDISFSSSCHDGYFGCYAAGGGDCTSDMGGSFKFVSFCGTSASAPSMAGVAALLNQKEGFAQGNLNPELYQLASSAPSTFHDATVGSSGVSTCSVATPSMCNNSVPGLGSLTGGQAGYLVTNGYDLVTGLGSLEISSFLAAFTNPFTAPTVTVTPSKTILSAAEQISVAVSVAGNPTPTGTVWITSNDNYTSAPVALANGQASILVAPGSLGALMLPVVLTVHYEPDASSMETYRQSTGSATVTVNSITPMLSIALSSANITAVQNLIVTVQASGGPGTPDVTGQVYVTAQYPTGVTFPNGTFYYSVSGALASGSAALIIPAGFLPAGVTSISANYLPDKQGANIYTPASTASPVTLQVTPIPVTTPALTVTPSAARITTIQPLTVTAVAIPAPGNPLPVGTMALTFGSTVMIGANIENGSATFNVLAGALPVGNDTITVSFPGDFNYNPATGSAMVTVAAPTQMTPTITITPFASSISTGQSLNVSVRISQPSGYPVPTGKMVLTSGSYSRSEFQDNGMWNVTIPAGSLPIGNDTLTITYTPDQSTSTAYTSATATASVNVVSAMYTISASAVSVPVGGSGTSTISVATNNAYTGTVSITCAVTSSPLGATNLPTCGAIQSVSLNAETSTASTTVVISTTSPSTSMVRPPVHPGGWAVDGATLALFFFAIPIRRRRNAFFAIAVVGLMGALVGCGGARGGNSGSTTSPVTHPGTTGGTYTVTLTATGSDAAKTTATTTFSLTVN